VSSRILSMAERCLLTLAERILRMRVLEGCSDIGRGTCGFSGELGFIDCPHDLIWRPSFGKKLSDQRAFDAGVGHEGFLGLGSD
jgi:hypothetical protein